MRQDFQPLNVQGSGSHNILPEYDINNTVVQAYIEVILKGRTARGADLALAHGSPL